MGCLIQSQSYLIPNIFKFMTGFAMCEQDCLFCFIYVCLLFVSGTSNGESQSNGDHSIRYRTCSYIQSRFISVMFIVSWFFPALFISVCPTSSQAESRQFSSCGRCRAQVFSQCPEVREQHGVSLSVIRGFKASPTTQALQTSSSNPPQTHFFTRSDIY